MTSTTMKPKPSVAQRLVLAIGGALTAASMGWTGWSIIDMVGMVAPLPAAIAVAVGLELGWLALVAQEWARVQRDGRVPRGLAVTGWIAVVLVVVVLAIHGALSHWSMVLLAAMPALAKLLWHWSLAAVAEDVRARRAEEQALSTDLTDEQQKEIARIQREARYLSELAAAQAQLQRVKAEARQMSEAAKHDAQMNEVKQRVELQMREEEALGLLERKRLEVLSRLARDRQVLQGGLLNNSALGVGQGHHREGADLSDPRTVDALWQGMIAQSFPQSFPQGAFSFDEEGSAQEKSAAAGLQVPQGASPGASGGASPRPSTPEEGQALLLEYMRQNGESASVRGAARQFGVDPRTIRRWRDALEAQGHDVSPLRSS